MHELLVRHLGNTDEVVDVTEVDLGADLFEGARQTRHPRAELKTVDVRSGMVLLGLLGPNSPLHGAADLLAALVGQLQPGSHAVALIGWPILELPADQLLRSLDDSGGQLVAGVPLDPAPLPGVESALIVARPDPAPAHLRLANEKVLAEFIAAYSAARLTALTGRVHQLEQQLAAAESTVGRLTSSVPVQVRNALVAGKRHPAKALVTVPRDLTRIVSAHRTRRKARRAGVVQRVVPIALPATGRAPGRDELLTMTVPSDLVVPRRLADEGLVGFETAAMGCLLACADVAGPGAILDIGANVGIYAGLASAMTERTVVAFEPWPLLVDVARKFSADNKLGYTTESIALGAENTTATFYLSDASDSSNSLAKGFRSSSAQIQVPVETLDSYVARTGVVPAVMKVDTEMTEPDVLAGAAGFIAEHRPWILCEVLAGRVEAQLQAVLAPLGYRWYHITDSVPLREAARIVGDGTYDDLMWLFAPEKPTDEFWTALRDRTAALSTCTAQRARALQAARVR